LTTAEQGADCEEFVIEAIAVFLRVVKAFGIHEKQCNLQKYELVRITGTSKAIRRQGCNQLFISGGAIFMNFNSMTSSHRACLTVVQLIRKRSHIILMYFCPQTRSP